MQIDAKSPIPVFQQIADQLRSRIRRGVHKPGEMLPSLRALAIEIRVNPNTVQRAYELLEREGAVRSRRGVGMFVATAPSPADGDHEQRLQRRLESAISIAIRKGIAPSRIRTLFESALHHQLQEVQR